jgi:hypothetical protein
MDTPWNPPDPPTVDAIERMGRIVTVVGSVSALPAAYVWSWLSSSCGDPSTGHRVTHKLGLVGLGLLAALGPAFAGWRLARRGEPSGGWWAVAAFIAVAGLGYGLQSEPMMWCVF